MAFEQQMFMEVLALVSREPGHGGLFPGGFFTISPVCVWISVREKRGMTALDK